MLRGFYLYFALHHCEPLNSHRSHQVNVVVPNACQCMKSFTLPRQVLLWIHPGGQSDSSEVHASNDSELAHSPANVGDAG